MSLDRNKLATAIKTVLARGRAENLSADQVAEALADAIHAYTAAASVSGIQGTVEGKPFAQSGSGKLQ